MAKRKIPWLAALLNILVTGLGYIYIGKRILFGVLLIGVEILAYIWAFTNPSLIPLITNPWVVLMGVLYMLAFGIDAYKSAKEG